VTVTNKTVQSVDKLLSYIGQCVLSVNGYSVNVRRGTLMPDAVSNVSIPRTQRFTAKWKTSGPDIAVIEKHQLTAYHRHETSSIRLRGTNTSQDRYIFLYLKY